MSERFIKTLEGVRVIWFRIGGAWFICCASIGYLFGLIMLVLAFFAPSSERTSSLLEAVGLLLVCTLFMYLGVRLVSVTAQELRDAPQQLAKRRDQFEAWINRERKDA